MTHFTFVKLGILALAALPGAALGDPPPWEPMAVPAEVNGRVEAVLVLLDGSGSVGRNPTLLQRARAAGRHAIAEAKRCTYIIVAVFGSKARVVADRFACNNYDRGLLLNAVETIPMNAKRTDVGLLEGLLRRIRDALSRKYWSRGFRLEVQVLTDGVPSPLNPAAIQTFDTLLGHQTTRFGLGEGLFVYRLDFEQPPAPGTSPGALLPETAAQQPEQKHLGDAREDALPKVRGSAPILIGTAVVLGLTALLACLAVVQRRGRCHAEAVPEDAGVAPSAEVVPIKSPAALRVTEWRVPAKGDRVLVNGPVAVRYTPNIPITLGSDESRVHVAIRTSGVSARLASITLDGRGKGTVKPLNAPFRFDGQEVHEHLEFEAEHPHVIAAGDVELQVEPVSVLSEAEEEFYQLLAKASRETSGVAPVASGAAPAEAESK